MNTFEKIVYALQADMETPATFGLWHIISFVLMIGLCVLLLWRFGNASDKTLRYILLITWGVVFLAEVYKQIVFSFDFDGTTASWSYTWYAFPFQFCSTPLYALPLAAFLKEGKVRSAVLTFLSTFSLFAGLAVMIYPNDVFISLIGINVQTMLHHGSQVVIGVLIAYHERHRIGKRQFLHGVTVFAAFALIAMVLNIAMHYIHLAHGIDATFNMFFISPFHDCTLPVLSIFYPLLPYPLFLICYLIGFSLVAALIYGIQYIIIKKAAAKKA